jgi:metal-responsive CopG/Arc/MetJ family transcriptional regulator
MSTTESRFPDKLVLRVPQGFAELVDDLARRDHQTRSEYIRQVLLSQLRADGGDAGRSPA